jgi:hypothetical protein
MDQDNSEWPDSSILLYFYQTTYVKRNEGKKPTLALLLAP